MKIKNGRGKNWRKFLDLREMSTIRICRQFLLIIWVKKMKANVVNLDKIFGGGYNDFWRSKKRYVVCKGSKASKKSTSAALIIILKMIQYPLSNTLVIRKTLSSLKDSCYAQLKWAINRLGVAKFWKCTVNPLQMIYLPTGQKILFRGMDDADKIASITVEHGNLCFAWLNESGHDKPL